MDARLRAGDAAGAEDVAAEAEKRWPADAGLRQRRAVLELARGRVAEAFTALDALEQPSTDLLFAALRILHGARAAGLTVEDPARDRRVSSATRPATASSAGRIKPSSAAGREPGNSVKVRVL